MRIPIGAILFALALAAPLSAARADASHPDFTDTSWSFRVTPYGWFAGMSGEVGVNQNLPVVAVEADFGEILDNIDWWPPPVALVGEARNGDFALVTDFMFMGLEIGGARTLGPVHIAAEVKQDTVIWALATSYRVLDQGGATLDLLAGVRLWHLDTEVTLAGPQTVHDRSSSKTWVDPMVGAVGHVELGNGFGLQLEADYGGFGAASDLDWQIVGTLQYALGESTALDVGYRYLAVDYSQGSFSFDVAMSGPIVAATFRF